MSMKDTNIRMQKLDTYGHMGSVDAQLLRLGMTISQEYIGLVSWSCKDKCMSAHFSCMSLISGTTNLKSPLPSA